MRDTLVMAVYEGAFGERLKALQKDAGLTNEQLARRIGTGLRNVQRWRSAQAAPRLDALVDLADALQVSLDELVGRQFPTAPGVAAERRQDPWVMAELDADLAGAPDPAELRPASDAPSSARASRGRGSRG